MGKHLRDWRTQRLNGKAMGEWREDEWTEDIYGPTSDPYDRRSREYALENDEVSSREAAFMDGYDLAA